MVQDSHSSRLSDAAAKSYERKVAFATLLFFAAVITGGVFLVKSLIGDPVTPLSPDALQQAATQPAAVKKTDSASAPAAADDGLVLARPRNAYDLPVAPHDKDPKLRFITGRVTAIVPRHDIMSNGSARQNLYARTEFAVPEHNRNCFFHQYMGLTAVYKVDDMVPVQYDPDAKDFCGTARIVK